MRLLDHVRVLLDESVGTRGAVRNCRTELLRAVDADQAVERLRSRLAAADEAHASGARAAS